MLDAGGGAGGASQTRPTMTDAQEITLMKIEAARARREQAERERQQAKTEATGSTENKRTRAEEAVGTYNDKVRTHQERWVDQNRGRYNTQAEAQAAWQAAWDSSEQGREAKRTLMPHLADYNGAVQHELRLAATEAGSDPAAVRGAVDAKAREIQGRENGGLTDRLLDDLVGDAADQVAGESPELRSARLDTTDLIGERNEASTNLQNVLDRRDRALANVRNMGLRTEIRDSFQEEVNAAQEAFDQAEQALSDGLKEEFSIALADGVVAQAEQGVENVNQVPARMRNFERGEALRTLGSAQHQRNEVLAGHYDALTHFTPEQIDAATQSVFAAHPELMTEQNFPLAVNVFVGGEALKQRPTIDMNMNRLSSIADDPETADWMGNLIETDPVSAAFVASLNVTDAQGREIPVYTMSPGEGAERRFAEEAPVTYAVLKYAGGSFEMDGSTLENIQPMDFLRAGQEATAGALENLQSDVGKTPEQIQSDRQRLDQLQLLMMGSGDVRTDYLRGEWERVVATESPEQSLDKMLDEYLDEEDFNNPDYTPQTEVGQFMRTLSINMRASFTPEQQSQIWGAIGGDVRSYINQQATILDRNYSEEDGFPAAIGEWQKQMGQFAPPPVADAIIDATTSNFDATLIGQHGGGRMTDGLQILADRAGPEGADRIADWATRPTGDDAYSVPLRDLMSVKEDGTGTTLGQALLNEMAADGADEYALQDARSWYQAGVDSAREEQAEQLASEQFELFNENRNEKLQDIFDDAIERNGDVFTQRLNFGTDPVSDNRYGQRLGLTPDNPNAGEGEALYTDPEKLEKIHTLKQIDWISRGANLPVDLNALIPLIARGDPLPQDDENLEKINKIRDWIEEVGGDSPVITFTPAVYAAESVGTTPLYLIRVEGDKNNDGVITREETTRPSDRGRGAVRLDDEDMIIDSSMVGAAVEGENVAWKYNDFEDFRKDNMLDDDGKLYLTGSDDLLLHDDNGDGHVDNINFEGLDAAITTGWEHARRWGDVAIGVAGIIAGGALIIGTGGLAAPLVAAGAAAWFTYRTVETAEEMSDHGQSFNPINTSADGAWFGVIDPTAGGFWLGAAASVSGFTALRPLAMGRAFGNLGRGATLADETMLATRTGTASTGLSRGLASNLVGRNGLQANIYRAELAAVPRTVAWTAQGSGLALTAGQAQSFYGMWKSGQLDLTDWSINSATWDLALLGGGVASIGGGVAATRAQRAAANARPPSEIPEGRTMLWAHRGEDGSYLFRRADADGQFVADVDTPWANGKPPIDVMVFETSSRDGGIAPENIHFFSRNRDGSYRTSRLRENGTDDPDFTATPVHRPALGGHRPSGNDDGSSYTPRNPDGSYRITTLDMPEDGGTGPRTSLLRDNNDAYYPGEVGRDPIAIDDPDAALGGSTVVPRQLPQGTGRTIDGTQGLIADADARVQLGLAPWLNPDTPPMTNRVVILHDQAFDAAYRFATGDDPTGIDGFVDRLPSGKPALVYVREGQGGTFDRLTLGHELLHSYMDPGAQQRTSLVMFDANYPEFNVKEGFAELATFRLFGPENYRNTPSGFRGYVEETAARHGGISEGQGAHLPARFQALGRKMAEIGFPYEYVPEALAVEHITTVLGNDLAYRAFFRRDQAALEQFISTGKSQFGFVDFGDESGLPPASPILGIRPTGGEQAHLPGAAQSLDAMLLRIAAIDGEVTRNGVYGEYQRTRNPQGLAARWDDETGVNLAPTDYLRRIRDLGLNRPAGSEMFSQAGMQSIPGEFPAEPLLSPIVAGEPLPDYTPAVAGRDAFHFVRAGGDPDTVTHRVYLNTDINHAGDVMDFVVRGMVDDPAAFPGVVEAKIFGPTAAGRRSDSIVIYVDGLENQQTVLQGLRNYQQSHPDHFLPEVPAMTEPFLPGISAAEEPSPAMMTNTDAILAAEGMPNAGEMHSFGGMRADAVYLAYRDALAAQQSTPDSFDFIGTFRDKVRERFLQFRIDPENPSRNLDDGGQAALPEGTLPVDDAGAIVPPPASGGEPPRAGGGEPPVRGDWGPPALPPGPRRLELTAGSQYLALPPGPSAIAQGSGRLINVRPPDGFAVNTQGVVTRAQYMFAVDRNGEAARILQNVSAGADHLAGVRPRESTLGSWAEFLVSRYDRRVARAAEKAPPLIDLYRSFYGPDAPPLQASEFAQQLTRVIRYVRALFSIAHDVHAHPEGYDARKGIYYTRLMQMAGRYSEVLGCGIPQGCGVGHYTNPNSPPLSYRGAAVLDARHLGEHQTLRSNYVKWADYMRQVANNDPALAVRIDQAAFMGDLDTVNSLVDGAPRHFAFYRESIKSLAQKEPHLALNAHYATTGFNPADPASGRYVLDMNVDHYYEVSGAGETTLQKENVNRQLQFIGENFDFENPAHIASAVRWLAVQKVMGKIMSIHSDWGIARMGENGSLVGTTDHGYTMFDPLLDLVSPFAQSSDSSVILDHAGGGRYVNYDPTPMTVPDWLADAGYGDTIPHQILKMEEARHRAPGVKFDISWNDNGIQFTTNGDLRAGLIRFMQRHPDAVLFGTDTVKPVNRSQYLQNLTTLTDFFIELGAVDRQLALNALRHNFERLADRSFAKTLDATTLRNLAGQLDDIARSVETPDSEPMRNLFGRMGQEHASAAAADIRGYAQVLRDKADAVGSKGVPGRDAADLIHNGVVVNGRDGQPHTITTGRSHMRGSAQHLYHGIEFEWIARTFIYDRLSGALGNLAPQGGAEIAPQPQNLPVRGGRSRTPDLSHPQTGTGAGAPWMEQGAARWMMLSDAAITAAGAAAGLIPFAGPIAGGARAGLFGRGLYRQEFSRRLWESIFEDGRGLGVSLFAHEVVKAGREMGIPESRLAEFVKSMMQMDVDADYVYTETAAWARANDPENLGVERVDWSKGDLPLAHHALMAVIGIGQISGDQALGVQASSLLHLDPRTRKGRRHNIYISATSAASGTGAWATTAATVAVLPPGVPQIAAAIAGTAFSLVVSGTQGMMIWQRIWANRFGRGNLNPELNDRFRHLQTRILEGIQAGGVAGAGNALTLGVLANGNLALMGVNVVLDLGVAWTADRARRIERARVGLEGGTDPTPSAKALERVLQALGLDAGAAAASNANPDAVKAWLDALEKGLDSLGW